MKRPDIAVFGITSNPPGLHHRKVAEAVIKYGHIDMQVIFPCGPRPDKATANDIPMIHRAHMTDLTFRDIRNTSIDFSDLEDGVFTRSIDLVKRFEKQGRVWLVVGSDLVQGGARGESYIQKFWTKGSQLWENGRFIIVKREDFPIEVEDLPPCHRVLNHVMSGSSTKVRDMVFHHQGSITGLVVPEVEDYIRMFGLYRGMMPTLTGQKFFLENPKAHILADPNNPLAVKLAKKFEHFKASNNQNVVMIFGGDGFYINSVAQLWHNRLPVIGINAGHIGFRLNDAPKRIGKKWPFNEELVARPINLILVQTNGEQGSKKVYAVNDAWIRSKNGGMTACADVYVDGKCIVGNVAADGILAASTTGSTAYAMSLGADHLPLDSSSLLVVPMAPFRPLDIKPFSINGNKTVMFGDSSSSKYPRPVEGFIDGRSFGRVDWLSVRYSRIASVVALYLPEFDLDNKVLKMKLGRS